MNLPFRLQLLGRFELRQEDGRVALPPSKVLAVLAYLACARDRQASRETLVELLWHEREREVARASLRQAVFGLRKALGAQVLIGDGDWLTLAPGLTVDVDEFQQALRSGAVADAYRLYGGSFIPDFASPGALEFEHWVDAERFRLRSAFLTAARGHHAALRAAGSLDDAIRVATRVRDTAPEDDENWCLLFESLGVGGRFAEVALESAALRVLRADEGREPEPQTETLLRRLMREAGPKISMSTGAELTLPAVAGSGGALGLVPIHPEFQGRTDLFAELVAAWSRSQNAHEYVRILVAAPGLGKTRLLHEIARRLRVQRAPLVQSTARQRERDDAYAMLASILPAIAALPGAAGISPASAAVLAGIVPQLADRFHVAAEVSTGNTDEQLRRRGLAVADLFGAVSEEGAWALLIDDLQWADASSLYCIERALARGAGAGLLLLGASRVSIPSLASSSQEIALPPLTVAEVGALLGSMAVVNADHWSDARTEAIQRHAGGSPFGVLQFLRAAIASEAVSVTAGQWMVHSETEVERLLQGTAVDQARILSISADERECLVALMLHESALSVASLVNLLQVSEQVVGDRLAGLERGGFAARGNDGSWSVAHALLRESAAELLTKGDWLLGARRLGNWLARTAGTDAEYRQAVRLLLSGDDRDGAFAIAKQLILRAPREAFDESTVARVILGGVDDPPLAERLRALVRARRRSYLARLIGGAAALIAVVAAAVLIPFRPVRLVDVSELNALEFADPSTPFERPLRVEVRNAVGLRSTWRDGDSVHFTSSDSGVVLRGRTAAVIRGGVAEFDSLFVAEVPYADRGGQPDYRRAELAKDQRFVAAGLEPVHLVVNKWPEALRIVDGLVNGRRLRGGLNTVRVAPGGEISGSVAFRYTTPNRGALYVLTRGTSWGQHGGDTLTLRSLLAGVRDARMNSDLKVRAPQTPGDYVIAWVQSGEPTGSWLLSGTNWRCGTPRWGDGNDLMALPLDTLLRAATERGLVSVPWLYCEPNELRDGRAVPIAVLKIEVR